MKTKLAQRLIDQRARLLIELARASRGEDPADSEADLAELFRLAEAQPATALMTIGRIKSTIYPRDETIGLVVRLFVEADDLDRAIETAARMRDPVPRDRVLVDSARLRLAQNDVAGALRMALAPGHGFGSVPQVAEIADVQERAGDLAGARQSVERALATAEEFLAKRPHDPTVSPELVEPAVTHWHVPPAGKEREQLQETAVALQVADLRSRAGDFPGALRALEQAPLTIHRDRVVPRLLARQIRGGDAPGAFARALQIEPASSRLAAIEVLADAVMDMKKVSGTVSRPNP
jgi:hypothetical protein